jgi:hypothetical protein
MRKLTATAAAGTLAVVGTIANPWTVPLAALVLWDAVWSRSEVDIQEREASVIWAMWVNRDEKGEISKGRLLALVNSERAQYGRLPLSETELKDAIALLKKMRCVERSKTDQSKWWLREWVRINWD